MIYQNTSWDYNTLSNKVHMITESPLTCYTLLCSKFVPLSNECNCSMFPFHVHWANTLFNLYITIAVSLWTITQNVILSTTPRHLSVAIHPEILSQTHLNLKHCVTVYFNIMMESFLYSKPLRLTYDSTNYA